MSASPSPILLEARNISCSFPLPGSLLRARQYNHAVQQIQLDLRQGDTLALVGESGSGKSTLAKILLGLQRPTQGEVFLHGQPLARLSRFERAKRMQPVFQDPYSSLNPAKTIASIISLPLRVHGVGTPASQAEAVTEFMELVGLPTRLRHALPSELSGGQRQRVAIARALILKPGIVICDEPTSALDVSVQSQILNLMQDLQDRLGLTYLMITHNLLVVRHMANRVAVMYRGRIVESGAADTVFDTPQDAYTRTLLASILTT